MLTQKVLLRNNRRRGSVIVYVTLALVALLGAAGLTIDVGNLYLQRDKAQRAADAAALAGALQLMDGKSIAEASTAAKNVAAKNDYDITKGATVVCTPEAEGVDAWYRVHVSKPAPVFFMAIFGWRFKTVGAPATATFSSAVNIDINGGGVYGANGPISLSLFGPEGEQNNGDRYSVKYLDNRRPRTPNPLYETVGQYGYNFNLTIPENYASINGTSKVALQIFDPDCRNINNNQNAQEGVSVDEMRDHNGSNTSDTGYLTRTQYTIYDTKGTVATGDDTVVAQADYRNNSKTDMAWVTPDGFEFDLSDITSQSGAIDLRINVKSTEGSSENGFNLRAGPPLYDVKERIVWDDGQKKTQYRKIVNGDLKDWWSDTNPFNSANGTGITATGRIPMNFNAPGTATITLGYVPPGATQVSITKFDTDTGAQSVYYNDGISTREGKLSGNGDYKTDPYDLGTDYAGGVWTATYKSGVGDTSVWDMFYVGPSLNTPGGVYLVK